MKTRVSMKLVLFGLAVASTLALASVASAQPGEFAKNGVLQPLADGFPKQAITIINIDDPGTRDGIYARTLQKVLRGISPVDILVSDEPAANIGTFHVLQDTLRRRGGPDGCYPAIITVFANISDLLLEPLEKELGVGPEDLNIVIVTDVTPYVLIQRKNPPWGHTFKDLEKYVLANPGKARYISRDVGTGSDLVSEYMMLNRGWKVTKIPQPGNPAVIQGVGSGNGDWGMTTVETVKIAWEAGKVEPLLMWGPSKTVPDIWKNEPNLLTYEQAGFKPPVIGGTQLGLAVPKQVPDSHREWLFKLFKAAASTEEFKRREQVIPGDKIMIMDPKEANQYKLDTLKAMEPVVRAIGMHYDQKK